jgi:predicted nuclease of restriction endonuclease-like (RecB) superfamily
MSLPLSIDYKIFFKKVKDQIQQAQIKASIKVNQELLLLYWQLWRHILNVQSEAERGDKVIPMLTKDLREAFPGMKWFSERNIKYMRRFAREYPNFEFGQQAVAQITWSHNILLLQKVKDPEQRLRYAQKAVENGRSRNVMVLHIERKLFE